MDVITFTKVKLPYGWLSNMSPHRVLYDGVEWKTAEHAFQANRFSPEHSVRQMLLNEKSPMTAKMVVKRYRSEMLIEPRSDADINLMRMIVGAKIESNPDLEQALVDTGSAKIIEDCTKRPHGSGLFWGAARDPEGEWHGQNILGEIWMDIREMLK